MYLQPTHFQPIYSEAIQMIDGEFDFFEMNNDLEMQLRDAEAANFYHNALNPEE